MEEYDNRRFNYQLDLNQNIEEIFYVKNKKEYFLTK
jgi:hypothetical protein